MLLFNIGNFAHSFEVDNVHLMFATSKSYKVLPITSGVHIIYLTRGDLLLSRLLMITNNNFVETSSYNMLISEDNR
jgi:hypothetical protein